MAKQNLGTVDTISSISDSTNFLVENGGSVRRTAVGDVPIGLTYGENGVLTPTLGGSDVATLGWSQVNLGTTNSTDAGYVLICRVTMTGANSNMPITLWVTQRAHCGGWISLLPANRNVGANSIQSFCYGGDIEDAYCICVDSTYFDIYLKKASNTEYMSATLWGLCSRLAGRVTITYPDEFVTEVPDGATQATNISTLSTLSDLQTYSGGAFRTRTLSYSKRRTGYKVSPLPNCEIYSKNNTRLRLTACA